MEVVVERWTQERRREHTRELLLEAAQLVFATKGFDGASLDEIADTAGYTRGAIYKHFASKEELFLAVNKRYNERYLEAFLDLIDPSTLPQDIDLASIAKRWRELQTRDPHEIALGMEFTLYMLRNPEARARVAEHRQAVARMIADFMDEQAGRLGVHLRIPALTLARVALAVGDGLELASMIEEGEDDLHEPFLELLLSAWDTPPPSKAKQRGV
jgi:AcrR family transcriptional regulator